MNTSDFDYDLPSELIAQEPLPDRSQSRMMVLYRNSGRIEHKHITDLPEYLNYGDLLVLNNTRVIYARVFGYRKDTGGKVELLLIEEIEQEVILDGGEIWVALYRASRRPKEGFILSLADGSITGEIMSVEREGKIIIKLECHKSVLDILKKNGVPPLPPYIKRHGKEKGVNGLKQKSKNALDMIKLDKDRYQTIYASIPGAVAAPTAGLHFTHNLIKFLTEKGVKQTSITLHVGLGTFKPVKVEQIEDHYMESERYVLSEESALIINNARSAGGRIIAVGSTTVRTLETVMNEYGFILPSSDRSSLFIYSPYKFKAVDVLLTNFHLPESTLIMMVSAFAGRDLILNAYKEAIRHKYRFYSYGDCMLIL